MRRLSFALLLSLALHLCVFAFFILGVPDKPISLAQRTPVSVHIRTVMSQREVAPTSASVSPNHEEPVVQAHQDKALPQKIPLKKIPSKPSALPPTYAVENNVSAPLDDTSPSQTTVAEVSPPKTETPSYVALHKDEIAQALQRAKSYPELARKRSIEGVVEVSFTIKPTGEVESVEATSSSQLLSNAAIESVHKAKSYFPLPLENVTIKVPMIYHLK